jgi:3-oxoadipate enol-lactonase
MRTTDGPDVPGIIWPKDRSAVTDDGATITYTFLGPDDGEVVALTSGFLCPDTWWHYLAPMLADHGYRVLLFHYRGIATSTLPVHLTRIKRMLPRGPFTVPRFAADLRTIVEHEQLERLALIGHSMGVQVMFEAYRQLRPRVTGLAALTGPYASPVHTLYGRSDVGRLAYAGARLAFQAAPSPALRWAWRTGWQRLPFLDIGRAVRAFGARTSDELVATYTRHAAHVDPYLALHVAAGMHEHSAEDVLDEVEVPTLLVFGGRDVFSPPRLGKHMWQRIPTAHFRVAPNGTHGTILEYPELVNGWVLDFLAREVAGTTPGSVSRNRSTSTA